MLCMQTRVVCRGGLVLMESITAASTHEDIPTVPCATEMAPHSMLGASSNSLAQATAIVFFLARRR